MESNLPSDSPPPVSRRRLVLPILLGLGVIAVVVVNRSGDRPKRRASTPPPPPATSVASDPTFQLHEWLYLWEELPEELAGTRTAAESSNIDPKDYVTPASCAQCHKEQFALWSDHPHAKMNATADQTTVTGRFDGTSIPLHGGTVTVEEEDGSFFISTEKGEHQRKYKVTRTIGSRFMQYYVGTLHSGDPLRTESESFPADHPQNEVVLPVGYWFKKEKWVPVYDVFGFHDHDFFLNSEFDVYDNYQLKPYYTHCGRCHTTMPEGYRILWDSTAQAFDKPHAHLELWPFLDKSLSTMTDDAEPQPPVDQDGLSKLVKNVSTHYGPDKATTLGISCEACHYGGREHAESKGQTPPRFCLSSPHVVADGEHPPDYGRTVLNVNVICSRCHSSSRALLPGGEIAKNSAEYLDAANGFCYSQLKCTQCHPPHTPTGTTWPRTPAEDDAVCISCHQQYSEPDRRQLHTHHPDGTAGSSCMNCHMPKVTEGIEDMVRTHRIDSPNREGKIEAGGVNACNLCHLDKSVAWTTGYLEKWYGSDYDEDELFELASYDSMTEPAGKLFLAHEDDKVRLSIIGAVKRQQERWLLEDVAENLDSDFMIVRQFAQDTIDHVLGIDLEAETGYRFWMTPVERAEVLPQVKSLVADRVAQAASP